MDNQHIASHLWILVDGVVVDGRRRGSGAVDRVMGSHAPVLHGAQVVTRDSLGIIPAIFCTQPPPRPRILSLTTPPPSWSWSCVPHSPSTFTASSCCFPRPPRSSLYLEGLTCRSNAALPRRSPPWSACGSPTGSYLARIPTRNRDCSGTWTLR